MLYSPRKFTIEPATSEKIDTEVSAFWPKNSKGYITSKFRTDEINELFCAKYCLWIEILNKSFEGNIEIEKGQRIDFFVVEPENLKTCTFQSEYEEGKEKLHLKKQKDRQEAF